MRLEDLKQGLRIDGLIPAGVVTVVAVMQHGPDAVAYVQPAGMQRAELLAPGHPLHDAVMKEVLQRYGGVLNSGTVLVSPRIAEPLLLVGLIEEIVDGDGATVARRFGHAYVDASGTVTPAGPAPYLECEAAPEGPVTDAARRLPWLDDAEDPGEDVDHRQPAARLSRRSSAASRRRTGEDPRIGDRAAPRGT